MKNCDHVVEPQRSALLRQGGWFLFFRLLVVTLFLGGAIFYQIRGGDQASRVVLPYLYLLAGLTYAEALISLLLLRTIRRFKLFIQFQVVWDLLFSTALVYLTGGIDSIFSFFFLLVILSAGAFLSRRELLFVASAAAILYGSLLDLQYYGYLRLKGGLGTPSAAEIGDVFFAVFVNVTGFFLTALLVGELVERLRRSELALERRKIDYEELDLLNRAILANIPSGLMIINEEGRIRSFNEAAQKITGYSLEAVYDQQIRDLFPHMRVFAESGFLIVHRGECSYARSDGAAGTLGYASSLVRGPQENLFGLLITFQDLTGWKEMEGQLKRSDRLAAVGRLASGMAHEIRNPLASISGSVQLLMEGKSLTDEDRRLMGIVVREADRLSALLTDFLLYARPAKPNPEKVNAADVVAELSDMMAADRRFAAVRIEHNLPRDFEFFVDRKMFRQVLWDLAVNAAESMPDGGTLRFDVDPSKRSIYIEDTGTGIPQHLRDRIFDPFFTTKERGTGLGLAIVHSIVEAHGGEISVAASASGGTRFRVRIPLSADQQNRLLAHS